MPPTDHKAALARLLAQATPTASPAPAITVYGGQVQIVVVTGGTTHVAAHTAPPSAPPSCPAWLTRRRAFLAGLPDAPHIYKEKPK
ncbi:hypothetical protein DF3PA_80050 [Candidatus Defluviicoccus seviourii]|uniref:Uncharacterized protein n=1 Tax=Candidatus Defluviicoccus seviourii TaxID=2565273 RepID=A0A564WHD0_9PROT|nr:hypothetical protein DF3PA_80050 [Candidatus Defluviicoccus seviourii]